MDEVLGAKSIGPVIYGDNNGTVNVYITEQINENFDPNTQFGKFTWSEGINLLCESYPKYRDTFIKLSLIKFNTMDEDSAPPIKDDTISLINTQDIIDFPTVDLPNINYKSESIDSSINNFLPNNYITNLEKYNVHNNDENIKNVSSEKFVNKSTFAFINNEDISNYRALLEEFIQKNNEKKQIEPVCINTNEKDIRFNIDISKIGIIDCFTPRNIVEEYQRNIMLLVTSHQITDNRLLKIQQFNDIMDTLWNQCIYPHYKYCFSIKSLYTVLKGSYHDIQNVMFTIIGTFSCQRLLTTNIRNFMSQHNTKYETKYEDNKPKRGLSNTPILYLKSIYHLK